MSLGGVVLIDGYGHSSFPGSRRAVDDLNRSLRLGDGFFSALVAGNEIFEKLGE